MQDDPNDTNSPQDDDANQDGIIENVTEAASDVANEVKNAASEIADAVTQPAPSSEGIALGQGKLPESDERTMGMLVHLLGAFTYFVGPLIIWLIKKDESPFVDDQGKEAVNFQIFIAIALLISTILGGFTGGCASFILYPVIGVINLVFCILGCLEANKGKAYRYPYNLRLIS